MLHFPSPVPSHRRPLLFPTPKKKPVWQTKGQIMQRFFFNVQNSAVYAPGWQIRHARHAHFVDLQKGLKNVMIFRCFQANSTLMEHVRKHAKLKIGLTNRCPYDNPNDWPTPAAGLPSPRCHQAGSLAGGHSSEGQAPWRPYYYYYYYYYEHFGRLI